MGAGVLWSAEMRTKGVPCELTALCAMAVEIPALMPKPRARINAYCVFMLWIEKWFTDVVHRCGSGGRKLTRGSDIKKYVCGREGFRIKKVK
jgi:hypothetical protein